MLPSVESIRNYKLCTFVILIIVALRGFLALSKGHAAPTNLLHTTRHTYPSAKNLSVYRCTYI